MYILIVPGLALLIVGLVALTKIGNNGKTSSSSTTVSVTETFGGSTTTPAPTSSTQPPPSTVTGATLTGDTPCPAADGSSARTITFAKAPPTCIDATKTYTATVSTNFGAYTATLDAKAAPLTVNNFVVLARYHYFDNTVCHRAIPGFMVQCGDPTATGSGGPGYTFADELPATGAYKIGSLAMANSGANTNGSQFFVITGQNGVSLPASYTLFGQVTDGLDTTVKQLDAAGNSDPQANGVPPAQQIVIQSVTITET